MVQDRLEFFTLDRFDLHRAELRTVFALLDVFKHLGYRAASQPSALLIYSCESGTKRDFLTTVLTSKRLIDAASPFSLIIHKNRPGDKDVSIRNQTITFLPPLKSARVEKKPATAAKHGQLDDSRRCISSRSDSIRSTTPGDFAASRRPRSRTPCVQLEFPCDRRRIYGTRKRMTRNCLATGERGRRGEPSKGRSPERIASGARVSLPR